MVSVKLLFQFLTLEPEVRRAGGQGKKTDIVKEQGQTGIHKGGWEPVLLSHLLPQL